MKITVGCDPEFFVLDADTKQFVPICGRLGGTKKEPIQVQGYEKGYMYQEDGAAAEFNIPKQTTARGFCGAVNDMLAWMSAHLAKRKLLPAKDLRSVRLTEQHLKEFPQLETIGCDPDIMAYSHFNGKVPVGLPRHIQHHQTSGIRGVGGHIHIGYDTSICPPDVMVKLLDLVIGTQISGFDKQGERRHLWGHAGTYREKPYGLEYRTPSNFWIWKPTIAKAMAQSCISLVESVSANMIAWQALFNNYARYYQYVIQSLNSEEPAGSNYRSGGYIKPILDTPIIQDVIKSAGLAEACKRE